MLPQSSQVAALVGPEGPQSTALSMQVEVEVDHMHIPLPEEMRGVRFGCGEWGRRGASTNVVS